MDNINNKKKKNLKWYHILLDFILSLVIYISMVLGFIICFKNEKTEAHTNEIQLYSNETITNLSGTTWIFDDLYLGWYEDYFFNVNFTSNNNNFTSMAFTYRFIEQNQEFIMAYDMRYNNNGSDLYVYVNGYIYEPNYLEVTFIDGQDIANSTLIGFLYQHATLQINEEFYNINYNLQNVLVIGERPTQISNLEEINIEFQNFNNYELPQNIMVENASYNWNYETGILTIYDATGNVNITIRAEYISGNYSFIELIDSVVLIPINTFFNLFNFEIFGVNIYALLTATLTIFVIIKVLLKVFK